jgi:rubredoxin-NAD+ reductase
MTDAQPGVVIVGSGLGGYSLARELRKADAEKPITVITADGGESYSKPMLSAAFAQNKTPSTLVMKTADQMEAELRLSVLRRTRLAAIDPVTRTIGLQDGRRLPYGDLVLAVGADPRAYTVPGSDAVTIHTVNDLDDYAQWRDGLVPGGRVLLIGAGLIGCEFANDLTTGGQKVSVVDPAPWPLGRLLPESVGQTMAEALTGIGIRLHLGRSVASVAPGRATLDDGTVVEFDKALSAIGLVPRLDLAKAAGLTVDRGIVVDRLLKTSAPHIYAIGDCAQTDAGPLPFVAPLMAEAKVLAQTLAGRPTPLSLPALPVVVKTPALPAAVCPPPMGAKGGWTVEGEGRDLKALFLGEDGKPLGFAVTGACVNERQTLAKDMPDTL